MDPDKLPEPTDDPALRRRVSDLEREEVADVVREAASEGRLTFTEMEERLESVYASRTYGELVEVTADLPGGPSASVSAWSESPSSGVVASAPSGYVEQSNPTINVFLSDHKRTGNWLAPQRQDVHAVLGDVTLDYTEAQVPYEEIFLDIKSILADVKIRVPQNAIVHLDGQPILGSVTEQGSYDPNAQTAGKPKVFHIKGTAILGEIKVKRGPRLSKRLGLT
ncbi:DUF1707 domain-containing protein [Kribbella sp. NBC_01245]|uniref:DUF1707 SHOCT-like domain-containing protein n=1 Tax=Kribbella sp. NBC_01245 TaxID=2903578 RepID=UPI002E2A990C|nr:DUF1707 domain-containing protein [Kribbella sp. NBC_01245]